MGVWIVIIEKFIDLEQKSITETISLTKNINESIPSSLSGDNVLLFYGRSTHRQYNKSLIYVEVNSVKLEFIHFIKKISPVVFLKKCLEFFLNFGGMERNNLSYMKFQSITLRRANEANEENYDNRKTIRGSSGNIYIDRDPKYFKVILNYLRRYKHNASSYLLNLNFITGIDVFLKNV